MEMEPERRSVAEDIQRSIFSTRWFAEFNGASDGEFIETVHYDGDRPAALLTAVCRDGAAVSGFSAPFGGPDFARQRESVSVVNEAIDSFIRKILATGIRRIVFNLRPTYYGDVEVYVATHLMNLGYEVSRSDISHGIELDNFDGIEKYRSSLRSPARRALKHARDLGAVFEWANDSQDPERLWSAGWSVLVENRSRRGWALSLTREYVWRVRDRFPDAIKMGVLVLDDSVAAAALVYSVMPRIDYVVYWGDAERAGHSVMPDLVDHLVNDAIDRRVSVVDCGTSGSPLVPNDGLVRFKTSIGARAGLRLQVAKDYS